MRVIAGKYKGRRFEIPHTFKARPTTDFAKENIFNVLFGYMDLEGKTALDLFSGTGSIAIELLSRGCSKVISVEIDSQHHAFIVDCIKKIGAKDCVPLRIEALTYIKACHEKYDIIFADPPYKMPQLSQIPDIIMQKGLLKEGGILIFEHGKSHNFTQNPRFFEHRAYGSVNFSLFK